MRLSICVLLFVLGSPAYGESKAEAALKAQIAEMEKRHLADVKAQQALAIKVAGLQSGQNSQQAAIVQTADAVDAGRMEASSAAYQSAAAVDRLRLELAKSVEEAKTAESNAKIERAKADSNLTSARAANIGLMITLVIAPCVVAFVGWLKLKAQLIGVHASIVETKAEAHAAYQEANTVNLKIASIGLKLEDGRLVDPNRSPAPRFSPGLDAVDRQP